MQKPREVSARVWQKASPDVRALLVSKYPQPTPMPINERRPAQSEADKIFRAVSPKNTGLFDVELFATNRFYRQRLTN